MGMRDLEFVKKSMPWLKSKASKAAASSSHSDTDDAMASAIGRLASRPTMIFSDTKLYKAYIGKVINSVIIDSARKSDTRKKHMRQVAGMRSNPSCDHDRVDRIERLLQALQLLDSDHRMVLELHLRGLSSAEIAVHSGLPASTVRSRVSAARRSLSKMFDAADSSEKRAE